MQKAILPCLISTSLIVTANKYQVESPEFFLIKKKFDFEH